MNGATYTVVDMEALEEEEVATIKSLPTIRVRPASAATASADRPWTLYTVATLDAFKQDLAAKSLTHPTNEDF
jgi:hypothetical protein